MPIDLKKFAGLEKERKKSQTVDWDAVIATIIESGRYFSVREVHNDLVHHAVSRYRVFTVLNEAADAGKLSKGYDHGMAYYGKPVEKKKKRRRRKKSANKS